MKHIVLLLFGLIAAACTPRAESQAPTAAPANEVPEWSKYAVWYQIFPERFRNGDPSNDPRPIDIIGAWPNEDFAGWDNTPWIHDWYEQEPWARESGLGFYVTNQARRYGGDIQGIIDQLDYLHDLGVTALYVNPINDSPSLHKFDARSYHHIDRNLGPDPEGDVEIMEAENPIDPSSWQWTAADSLFLVLVDEVHRRGMRIIVDYSWNHTGSTFWAFKEAIGNPDSRFVDWYVIDNFDDPDTPENESEYQGWFGVKSLPEIREIGVPPDHEPFPLRPFEGNLPESFKQHVFDVTERWLDPNGDGDPSDGIDGYRLDVAGEVPLGFWREYRTFVKGINPDAYLVGEIWWEEWPDALADPNGWLGPVFDATMNYRWFPPMRSFLNGSQMFAGDDPNMTLTPTPSHLAAHLDSLAKSVPLGNAQVMMNTAATHDTPRLSSAVYNTNPYKAGSKFQDNDSYKIERPDDLAFARVRILLALQFAYVGAPQIWNGDEFGMWGADDPDNRKPVIWPDLTFDDEVAGPDGAERPRNPVSADLDLLELYKRLISIRKANAAVFVEGDLSFPVADDERGVLVMSRQLGDRVILVAVNRGETVAEVKIPVSSSSDRPFENLLENGSEIQPSGNTIVVQLAPNSAKMLANAGD